MNARIPLALALVVALASNARAQDAGPPATADAGAPSAEGTSSEGTAAGPEGTAAEPQQAEPESEPPPAPPRSTTVGELASQTRVVLQRARPLFRQSGDVLDIERQVPRAEREVARLRDPARMAPIARLSQREIADLRQQWRRRGESYEEWQATLNERASELEAVRNELVTVRRRWRDLRAEAIASGASEGRLSRILSSLDALRDADDQIDARLEEVLALQERVSELGIAAEDVTDQLRAAAAAYRERLFDRDRPPLWIGLEDHPPEGPEGPDAIERTIASLALIGRLQGGLMQLAALFVVLAVATIAFSRSSRTWPTDDPSLAIARAVASRPISTALLAALLATPLVMRHAPIVLYDLVFVALLAPLARVLWPLAPAYARPLVLASVVLLLVSRAEAMGSEDAVLGRVLLLVESTAVVAVTAWWVVRERARAELLAIRIRTVAVALAIPSLVALIANVLGYVFLAKTLVRGTAFSLSSGLSLVAMLLVAEAWIDVALRSEMGKHLRMVRDHAPAIGARLMGILSFAGALAWVLATIAGYGLLNPLENWFEDALERRWTVGTLDVALGDLAIAIAILATTLVLARLARFVLEIEILPRMKLEPGVDGAISGLTRYLLVAIGILLALAAIGIDAGQIAIVAGALGVGVGFGLQGIVANVIAGFVLMLERPVRLGDFIEVGPLIGRVERIGLRSSTVRAADGAEVIVPNESLISREVVNWTLSDRRRRIQVKVGVAYGTDPQRTLEILKRVASTQQGVLGTAAIDAMFEGFGASSLDFVLQFWTDDFANASALRSQVGLAVHDALTEAGIEIPFPQLDVTLKNPPPAKSAG